MGEPVSGSSFPQTREHDQHQQHLHSHTSRDSHNHNHQHHHARSQNDKNTHKRDDSDPTIIVETISVLQLIDNTGAVLTVQTLPKQTASPRSETEAALTVEADPATATYPGPPDATSGDGDDNDGDNSLSSASSTTDPTVTPSESSMPTSFPTLSYAPLTSTHLTGSPAFPSLAGVTNTTSTSISSSASTSINSTSSLLSFTSSSGSSFSIFSSESSTYSSGSTSSRSSSESSTSSTSVSTSTSSSASSSTSGSFSGTATSTGPGSDGYTVVGGGDGSTSPTATAAAGDDPNSNSGATDQKSVATVAGSVLGAVAGVAFILVLALVAIRWKKRQNTLKLMRGSTGDRGPGGLLRGGSAAPSGGGGAAGDMSQRRRSIPFAVPAALANLSGYKRFSKSTASSDGGEKGFTKVSGRKLPPVLQFGGDGYTDPRATMMSDQSIEYRDSQMWLGQAGPSRLAVGSPMRPESGIPVFHASPARTPVTRPGPFSPYTDSSPLEPPQRDPLGRSHPSRDGSTRSHGSASRFTEEL
ncbi:Uu.00g089120.m01.CDS01 [Anthostomella pinea]|uniref:Uu.00g089120.m01.CDS01 n=1 Tax=Anthostomella pinea TaxID=933095 RepID=A0AAI8YK13_9PEZI|nr:Uu.00g089120.m01.CDS01 [Anthostomella pinea]